jgi:hypothetical protein
MSPFHRLRQGIGRLFPVIPPDRDFFLTTLKAPARSAFLRLPAFDQAHLCDVARALRSAGEPNLDLLDVALLHDIGKSACGSRVRLLDRTLNVLLAAISPSLLQRLAVLPAPRWRLGLALAVHHPRLGAEMARSWGYSERVCWLIEYHADTPLPADPALQRLVELDHATH